MTSHFMRYAWTVFVVVVGTSACAEKQTVNLVSDTTVELDAFSGLPNPEWKLTAAQTSQLEGLLADLEETNAAVPEARLGYRGFYVRNADTRLQITNGLVIIWNRETPAVYRDSRGAEDFLRSLAVAHGYGEVVNR